MNAIYLCPWHKMTTWFSPLSRMLAASNVPNGIVERLAPAVRIYVLIKKRVLALSCMGVVHEAGHRGLERERRTAAVRHPCRQADELHPLLAGIRREPENLCPNPDKAGTAHRGRTLHGRHCALRLQACPPWPGEQEKSRGLRPCD